jgi:tetratricopeptide (TPR) repeat protein
VSLGGTTAYSAAQYAMLLADRGDPDRGDQDASDRFMKLALETVEELGQHSTESSVHIMMGFVASMRQSWKEALDAAQKARPPAQTMLAPYHLATCDTIEGQARFHLGEREAGLAALRRGVAGIERCKLPMTLTWSLACLAEALAHRGEWDEADRIAREALARGPLLDRLGEDIAQRTLFRVAIHRNPESLADEAKTLLESCDTLGSPRARALADVCIQEPGA